MKLVTYRIMVSVDVTMQEGATVLQPYSGYGEVKPALDQIDVMVNRARKAVRKALEADPGYVSVYGSREAESSVIVGPATAAYEPLLLVTTP